MGDGQRTCTCNPSHTVGDGITCHGRVVLVMIPRSDPDLVVAMPQPELQSWLRPPDSILSLDHDPESDP